MCVTVEIMIQFVIMLCSVVGCVNGTLALIISIIKHKKK